MPAQPRWFARFDRICNDIAAWPQPLLERSDLEQLLGIGRRRAQQLLEGCATGTVGASAVSTPEALLAHLRALAAGDAAGYERRRQQKVARVLSQLQADWTQQPRLLVEAPVAVTGQRMENLPAGVELGPGRLTVEFLSASEGLEKLLALAMAIGNDIDGFERRTAVEPAPGDG